MSAISGDIKTNNVILSSMTVNMCIQLIVIATSLIFITRADIPPTNISFRIPEGHVDSIFRVTQLNSTAVSAEMILPSNASVYYLQATVNITYSLMLGVFSANLDEPLEYCDQSKAYYILDTEGDHHFRKCVNALNGFVSEQGANLISHCFEKNAYFLRKNTDRVEINGLLPGQRYKFKFVLETLDSNGVLEKTFLNLHTFGNWIEVCTPQTLGPPSYSPRADASSFHVMTTNANRLVSSGHNMDVDLYWRPLPIVLVDSDQLNYRIQCHNELGAMVHDKQIVKLSTGIERINKAHDSRWLCYVYTENPRGLSHDASIIVIPEEKHIIIPGSDFRFYVAIVNDKEAIAKWTPIDETLDDATQNHKWNLTGSYYVIHKCRNTPDNHCKRIDNMIRTEQNQITIPILDMHDNLYFGISYHLPNEVISTGIIWLNCLADPTSIKFHYYEPLKLTRTTALAGDNQTVLIKWDYVGCASKTAVIKHFEIEYCIIEKLPPCSSDMINLGVDNTSYSNQHKLFHGNEASCKTIIQHNNLLNRAKLENLDSLTRYLIRVRYFSNSDDTSNTWSEPAYVTVPVSLQEVNDCFRERKVRNAIKWIAFVSLVVGAIYFTIKTQRWLNLFANLRARFSATKYEMSKHLQDVLNQDHSGEMGLKYWINRFPNQQETATNSNSSLSVQDDTNTNETNTNNNDRLDANQTIRTNCPNSCGQVVLDYIPRNLVDGLDDKTISDTDCGAKFQHSSDFDDISITSHSSFLNTILNRKPNYSDINYNGDKNNNNNNNNNYIS